MMIGRDNWSDVRVAPTNGNNRRIVILNISRAGASQHIALESKPFISPPPRPLITNMMIPFYT